MAPHSFRVFTPYLMEGTGIFGAAEGCLSPSVT